MSAVESTSPRSIFAPNKKETRESGKIGPTGLKRNSESRKNELEAFSKSDSKVDIPDAIKDFARIKKVADAAPEIDKSDKIERLKAQIADGSYKIDYDGLSDIIMEQEF
jgi:negative regulator of flagellin synthesis FlgM